jgi:hypothetical protein
MRCDACSRRAAKENIQLTLAINPVHALDLELLRTAGGWERLEDWKRQVVKLIAEESLEDRVAFWDFTDYSQPTTEEVPLSGDTTTRMKLYFENSHYTPAMGALMLDRMFRGATNDFGVRIPQRISRRICRRSGATVRLTSRLTQPMSNGHNASANACSRHASRLARWLTTWNSAADRESPFCNR